MPEMSEFQRNRILEERVGEYIARGYRVEHQTPTSAVVARGNKTNHVLHLILSLLTMGAWVVVWLIMALINTPMRKRITVDAWGNVGERAA